MTLIYCGYAKNSVNVAMYLQVLPQNIPLLWQMMCGFLAGNLKRSGILNISQMANSVDPDQIAPTA